MSSVRISERAKPRMNLGQTARAFGVSTMAVWNWRKGVTGREPLPVVIPQSETWKARPQVYVEIAEAKKYAKAYGLVFTEPKPEDLTVGKPGPKPRPPKGRGSASSAKRVRGKG